jgi:hypothetical protein
LTFNAGDLVEENGDLPIEPFDLAGVKCELGPERRTGRAKLRNPPLQFLIGQCQTGVGLVQDCPELRLQSEAWPQKRLRRLECRRKLG